MNARTDNRQHAEGATVELGKFSGALVKQPIIVFDEVDEPAR
jgi:hypothetical protein